MHLFFIKQISAKISSIQLIQGSFKLKQKHILKKNAHFIVRVLKKKNRLLCVMRRQRRVVSTLSLSAHVSDNNLRIKEQKKKNESVVLSISVTRYESTHSY